VNDPTPALPDDAARSPHRVALVAGGLEQGALDSKARLRSIVTEQFDFTWRSLRRLGVAPGDVDDAAQQVFIVMSRRLADVPFGRERAFLFSTAVRVASDARRTYRRRHESPDAELGDTPDSAPSPDDLVDQRRARVLLTQLLEEMPMDLRTVFVLFELEQMSRTEVARVLGMPAGTVASRLSRSVVTEPERYWDSPVGDARRRVVQSSQLDVPSPDAKAQTLALLGLEGLAPVRSPSPRRFGRWLAVGVAGVALLGGWIVRSRMPQQVATETSLAPRDPVPAVATSIPAAGNPGVEVPIVGTVASPIAAAPPLPEKRREGEDDLGAQLALIDGARAMLANGSARDALAQLREYDARYPAGALGPEALALRVEALLRSGEQARGRALGDRFVAQHPKSPYAARIRSLLAQAP
jgi:RNA polymerase sigma-70 factor, ECF subfamily